MSRTPASPRRVLLFGKVPRPGQAKTRLAPALGDEGAARLYRAFLADTVALARGTGAEVELWLAGPAAEIGEGTGDPDGITVRRQPDGDLGRRLRHAFEDAFGDGVERAVALGTDHPTLPSDRVEEAFRAARDVDVGLGPTADGGYYLLALRRSAWPRAEVLFRDVPWSTDAVAAVTRRRAREAGLSLRSLEAWYDVDEPDELERLREDVAEGSATARALDRLDPSGG